MAWQPLDNHAWVKVGNGKGESLALKDIESCHAKHDANNPTICKGDIDRGVELNGAINEGALTNTDGVTKGTSS